MATRNIKRNNEEDDNTSVIIPKGVLNPSQTTIIKIPSRFCNTGPLVVVKSKHHHESSSRRLNRNESELEKLFADYKPLQSKMSPFRLDCKHSFGEVPCNVAPLQLTPFQVRASSGHTQIHKKASKMNSRPISPNTIEIYAGDSEVTTTLINLCDYYSALTSEQVPVNKMNRGRVESIRYDVPESRSYLKFRYPLKMIENPPYYPGEYDNDRKYRKCYKHDSIAEIREKLYTPLNDRSLNITNFSVPVKSVTGNLRIPSSRTSFQSLKRKVLKKHPENYYNDPIYATTVPVRFVR